MYSTRSRTNGPAIAVALAMLALLLFVILPSVLSALHSTGAATTALR